MNKNQMNHQSKKVAAVFEKTPPAIRKRLLVLRKLIFDIASKTPGVGSIEETLKWDSPSYLTSETQSGTTIRISALSPKGKYGIFVHCQSNVVKQFKQRVDTTFEYDSTRGLVLDVNDDIPPEVKHFIYLALTYHLRKKKRSVKQVWVPEWVC
ncbi:MAG: DUF1801 domain-containing protein [Cyclobacteriaceae bacterium]|nr:DUF1801 domain-containing protein [Cyclobacteriaceae bacterium]